ncbi:ankyrin repeat domain-containing protein [Legionella hackeliae]|uniref:F-box domain-containing protein n=1 Tax=Legionella hackeliae TaxID=449 RepID=A0A0A8UR78_LEGHA|nr:ankyrin repeat domain-containing protein [Legionella hackeliae]KTD13433.1 Ankyrin repeat protein [Legionella hackeliae]CEK09274.1 protein of unknown function [ankyrin and F-box domain] [Legionella hackeliae]STX49181.1 Ankyrin repeat protein [Legionella hackeliae]
MKIKHELREKKIPVPQIQLLHILLNEIRIFFKEYSFPAAGTDIYADSAQEENYFTAVNELSARLPSWLKMINAMSKTMLLGDVITEDDASKLAAQLIKLRTEENSESFLHKEQLTSLFVALNELASAVNSIIEFVNDRDNRRFQLDGIVLKNVAHINQLWQPVSHLDSIPDEVLFAILQCLPSSKLHEVKQVSKRFYSIIKDPVFINSIVKQYLPQSTETDFRKKLEAQWPNDKEKHHSEQLSMLYKEKHFPELLLLLFLGNEQLLKEKIKLESLCVLDKDKLNLMDWMYKTNNRKILGHIFKNIIVPYYQDKDKKKIRMEIGGLKLLDWAIRCHQSLDRIKGLRNLGFSHDDNALLHEAARANHIEVLQWLLKKPNVDVNAVNSSGYTPLFLAVYYGHVEVVQHLLASNKINANICFGSHSALDIAATRGHVDVIKLLLAYGETNPGTIWKDSPLPLYLGAQNGRTAVVTFFLGRYQTNVNAPRANGATALFVASLQNQLEVIKLFLAHDKTNVNASLEDGSTALLAATEQGHVEVVRLLLGHDGIEVNACNRIGATALFLAARKGHVDVVKLLLAHNKIDVNVSCVNGHTALYVAAKEGHSEVAKILLADNRTRVNARTANGKTALFVATQRDHDNVVKVLLDHGADVNVATKEGVTALHEAVLNRNTKVVNYLLANKASIPEKMRIKTKNALALVKNRSCKNKLRAWLQTQYQNPLPAKIAGITALDLAIFAGSSTIVKRMIESVDSHDEIPEQELARSLEIAKILGNEKIIKQVQKILPSEEQKQSNGQSSSSVSTGGFFATAKSKPQSSSKSLLGFFF